jgi:hypothetical protein
MAKKARRAVKPDAPAAPAIGLGAINPFGPTQQRKIRTSTVKESVFTLNDGTRLIVKPIVSDIRRAVKQYNFDGQPLYFLTLGNTIVTKAPKRLMKPVPKRSKKSK